MSSARGRCPVAPAVALSLKDDVTCRRVDISKVQKALKKQGVRIP